MAVWYDLVNDRPLAGTGLPCHPWLHNFGNRSNFPNQSKAATPIASRTLSAGKLSNGSAEVDVRGAMGQGHQDHTESYGPPRTNKSGEEANFSSMSLVADNDEWSAMLVRAGFVGALVNLLQACLDARITAQSIGLTSIACKDRSMEFLARPQQAAEVKLSEKQAQLAEGAGIGATMSGCVGLEPETAQVKVLIALGALLTAHPLAARDRFQLVGGAQRLSLVLPGPEKTHHEVSAYVPHGDDCTHAAFIAACPFLREHFFSVALLVLRLCLRADVSEAAPPDIVEGTVRVVDALLPIMQSAWERHHRNIPATEDKAPPLINQEANKSAQGSSNVQCRLQPKSSESGLSRKLLPLRFPEVVMQPAGRAAFDVFRKGDDPAEAVSSTASSWCTTDFQSLLDSPPYLLCG